MNRISYILIFIVFALGFDILLINRYETWGVPYSQIFSFIIFLVIAEVIICLSILKFKEVVNPFTVYALYIGIFGYSFLQISEKQEPYTLNFLGVSILSMFFFIGGLMVGTCLKPYHLKNIIPKFNPRLSKYFINFLLLAGIATFVMEIRQLGFVPILSIGREGIYSDINSNDITPLHNFIVLCGILPVMYFVHYKKQYISFLKLSILTCICFFITVNFFSRQVVILLLIALLLGKNYYKKIPPSKFLIYGIVTFLLFIFLGQVRAGGNGVDVEEANFFLKLYAEIDKPTNILETYITLYGAVNFTTADRLINIAVDDSFYSFGKYTLRPLLASLPISKSSLYPLKYSSYDLLGTYIVDPFLDFRWAGVVIINFLYGFFAMNSFKKYAARVSEYYILEWALVVFCIFMAAFTNYVNTFFIFFLFIANRITTK